MRGTYTATYLDQVAKTFAKRRKVAKLDIGAAFELIVGTSTGAIVACGLAKGVPMSDVVSLYRSDGPKVFSKKLPSGLAGLLYDAQARPAALRKGEEVLRQALTDRFQGTTLKEIYEQRGIALAIPTVEMSQHRSWVFKTPHHPATNHRDDDYTLVDVCLASTAAPVFRSLAAIPHPGSDAGDFHVFVDGGLWANNPVIVGLIDALDIAEPDQPIEIFCLGTCPVPAGEQIALSQTDRGLLGWKFGGEAASLSIDAQQFAFDHMARKLAGHLKRECSIVRFPSDKVPAALVPYLALDETRPEAFTALINQARTDADMTNSKCMSASMDADAQRICDLFMTMPTITQTPEGVEAHV
jgi:hypothetical protein